MKKSIKIGSIIAYDFDHRNDFRRVEIESFHSKKKLNWQNLKISLAYGQLMKN